MKVEIRTIMSVNMSVICVFDTEKEGKLDSKEKKEGKVNTNTVE